MQVGRRQGRAEENDSLRRAEHVGAGAPQLPGHYAVCPVDVITSAASQL